MATQPLDTPGNLGVPTGTQDPVSSGETGDLRLGIVGAGKAGTTIARAAITAGYDVAMSGSGPAEGIALIVDVLAPGARAVTTDEVVRHADLIVLGLNQLGYHEFEENRRPRGAPGRVAIAAAGDDPATVIAVTGLIDGLGFDAVDAGPLEAGLALEPDGPAFGVADTADELSNPLWPRPLHSGRTRARKALAGALS
jgi:8-hydroxy-5-deazaflavin:NADPH oxidoreductase